MLSFQHQSPASSVGQAQAQQHNELAQQPPPHPAQQQPPQVQMRLRDDPPPITPPTRSSRKRKTPPPPPSRSRPLPPPRRPPSSPSSMSYPLHTPSSTPSRGLCPRLSLRRLHTRWAAPGGDASPHPSMAQQPQSQVGSQPSSTGRTLSNSKRAEQNRKAQRAFRERRDQHVKALESRSQLLDAALASADEANRRWEECRALVDQLRIENAALRAALSTHHPMIPPSALPPVTPANGATGGPTVAISTGEDEKKPDGSAGQGKQGEEAPAEKD